MAVCSAVERPRLLSVATRGIFIAATLAVFLCVAADRANAASQVWTTPGAVTLVADDNPHHFVVWNSLSRFERDFVLLRGGPSFDSRPAEVQSEQLDEMVDQCQQVVRGIEPQSLRDNSVLRSTVATELTEVQSVLDDLLVDRPRRNILRRPR